MFEAKLWSACIDKDGRALFQVELKFKFAKRGLLPLTICPDFSLVLVSNTILKNTYHISIRIEFGTKRSYSFCSISSTSLGNELCCIFFWRPAQGQWPHEYHSYFIKKTTSFKQRLPSTSIIRLYSRSNPQQMAKCKKYHPATKCWPLLQSANQQSNLWLNQFSPASPRN